MIHQAKYFFKNTIWAIQDYNSQVTKRAENFLDELSRNRQIKELGKDSTSLKYDLVDSGNHVQIGGNLHSVFGIQEFPQLIYPNWLYDLNNYGEPIIISQFIEPLDPKKALSGLRNRITNLSAEYYQRAEKGKIHTTDIEQAIQDARNVEDAIVRGAEKLYSLSMYVKLSSNSESDLTTQEKAFKDLAYAKQIKAYKLLYKQDKGIEGFLPTGIDRVEEKISLTSSNVAISLPFTTATLNDPDGIFYGLTMGATKVRFDRFSKSSKNFNGIIFATSGAGKSFAAKLEAYRSLFRGISVFVIDPEGEFKALCDYVGGTNIDINPESKTKVNPLQFFSNDLESKETMRQHLGVVKGLLKIWLSESAFNRGIVSKVVNQTYFEKGILLEDPKTYSKLPPTISDLIEQFKLEGSEGKRIATELLEYSKKGELGDLYDNQTSSDIDFNSPMVVFNIQKVPEAEKQAAIYYLSNFIWQKVLADRERKILIIDEAHLLLKEESSAVFMENLVRRGRKYNLGVISISQDVDDFLKHPQGSVIAKNAETALILAQKKQSIPSLAKAFDLSPAEEDFVTRLTKGQSLFIKGNIHTHLSITPTLREVKIFSSQAKDLEKLDSQRRKEAKE